jgi:hypothetical protein
MTTTAREVLRDCEIALQMLESEEAPDRWRVLWAGAIALLRSVGYVLEKVDSRDVNGNKNALFKVSSAAFDRWKKGEGKDAIFVQFIENERNNILKEYRSSVFQNPNVTLAIWNENDEASALELDLSLYHPIVDGYGANEDARDIYRNALDWWAIELSKLEREVAQNSDLVSSVQKSQKRQSLIATAKLSIPVVFSDKVEDQKPQDSK